MYRKLTAALAASAAALLSLSVPVSGQTRDSVSMSSDGNESKASVYFKDGKFNVRSRDGKFHLWLDNRIYTDASFYFPTEPVDGLVSKVNKDLEEDDGVFRFSNGVSIRRARFAIKAELYDRWFAEFDLDFAYNVRPVISRSR